MTAIKKNARRALLGCLAAALLTLGGCTRRPEPAAEATPDPYEGMVQVQSGFGTLMWVKELEGVPVHGLDAADFSGDGERVTYTGEKPETLQGIDVSEHQGEIDWEQAAGSGIDFVMVRAGYRGYSQGGLFTDPYFERNMRGALDKGLRVGVYFFSQAVTPEEAMEEADYLLGLLADYGPERVTLPVVFDWENINGEAARTDGLEGVVLTACARVFCDRIRQAGYDPGVYAYRYLGYFTYDLERLSGCKLWIGALGDSPDFYYRHDIWQYSISGRVPGVTGEVDRNLLFVWNDEEKS